MRLHIQRLAEDDKSMPTVTGSSTTIAIPDPPVQLSIWKDLITWLNEHPEIIMMILAALAGLFAVVGPAQKALENPAPPKK